MTHRTIALASTFMLFPGLSPLAAQELEEACPDSPDGTGALWGVVSDAEAEVALPGATVEARWMEEGTPEATRTQTGFDGGYTLCYLPLETEISVVALLGDRSGVPVSVTLTESVSRQDLGYSLTATAEARDTDPSRMWACIGSPDSQIRMQLGRLVRCDPGWKPLEQCPKEELGRVSAPVTAGAGGGLREGGLREAVERLITDARRLGGNALVDFGEDRGSVRAVAAKIEVDPATC